MFDKSKKGIIKAIKTSKGVHVNIIGMTADDSYYIQVTKIAILDIIAECGDHVLFEYHTNEAGYMFIG